MSGKSKTESTESKDILADDPILMEIVRRLVAEFHPKRVFLFGSRARGEGSADSDYDILVIMPTADAPGYRLAQRAHRSALRGIPAPIDVIFFSEQKFEERKSVIGSLPETAIHEGKELYAA
ncbi:nucleotidyltransferase domain-containing protein [Bdellovibrionota bacterium FG-2]